MYAAQKCQYLIKLIQGIFDLAHWNASAWSADEGFEGTDRGHQELVKGIALKESDRIEECHKSIWAPQVLAVEATYFQSKV